MSSALRGIEVPAYDEYSVLKKTLLPLVVAALSTLAAWGAPGSTATRSWNEPFGLRSASAALPQGFVLPASDVDVKVSSLVAADVDADGDLDIVASERVGGSLAILVWENDGAGRLTRRQPSQPHSLDNGPASPAFEQHRAETLASIQPDSPVMQTIRAAVSSAPATQSFELLHSPDIASAALELLRSRSPPVRS